MEKTARRGTRFSVFIVDDHPLVRQGLAMLIDMQGDLRTAGEASDFQQALEGIASAKPDLAIVDLSLKGTDGLELTKALRKRHPRLAVLVISMYDEAIYAERALKAGARGYIMKREANEELLNAIRRVLAGKVYLSENFSSLLLEKIVGRDTGAKTLLIENLTDREMEVLRLVGMGRKNQEMAALLGLSHKTIQVYKEKIKRKLNLKNSSELAHYAINWLKQ
ncbi:MAG TPA: DNA-binding response regulator [candidate division Zixibacteria bacterium]|jgi:DNA-binding NarL/FixJ family response regulator|nr:DNA-binding response regulator [candidate division Zixibacteria bacterium]